MMKKLVKYLSVVAIVAGVVWAANGPQPSVGLYWYQNSDPTAGGGVSAPLNQLLIRTDVKGLYYKSGGANTAWTAIAGAAAGGGTVTSVGCGLNMSCTPSPITGAGTVATVVSPTFTDVTATGNIFASGAAVGNVTNAAPVGFNETWDGQFSPMLVQQFFNGQLHNINAFKGCRGTHTVPLATAHADSMALFTASGCDDANNPVVGDSFQFRITNANVGDILQMPANSGNVAAHLQIFLARPNDPNPPERARMDWMGHFSFASQGVHFGAGNCHDGANPGICTVITNCGTGPADALLGFDSSASGDNTGAVIVGTADTGCTVTFSGSYGLNQHPSAATCLVQVVGANLAPDVTYNNTGFVITDESGQLAGLTVTWHCLGASGGNQQ